MSETSIELFSFYYDDEPERVIRGRVERPTGTEDRVADSVLSETVFPVRIRDRVIGRLRQGDR